MFIYRNQKLKKRGFLSNNNFDGETAQKYNVTSVPTLVFFKDGAEKARLTGAVKKAQLAETINSID